MRGLKFLWNTLKKLKLLSDDVNCRESLISHMVQKTSFSLFEKAWMIRVILRLRLLLGSIIDDYLRSRLAGRMFPITRTELVGFTGPDKLALLPWIAPSGTGC